MPLMPLGMGVGKLLGALDKNVGKGPAIPLGLTLSTPGLVNKLTLEVRT